MELDMTKGSPSRIILRFFIPLFIGDLFQQLYSIIDAIIIGRFVGTDAFAAVGSSSSVILFITSVLLGLAMGASAVFSQLYGSKKFDVLKETISTALIFLFCTSVLITILTLVFLPEIIVLYQIPDAVKSYAYDYLKYIFGGFIFVGMYNAFAFLLRAFGDSKTPLYFLTISCLCNAVLCVLFVAVLHWGTAGAAGATVLSQAFSAIGCGIYSIKRLRFLKFKKKEFRFRVPVFRNIAVYSILTALQQSISSFGMMMIQGLVNTFGTTYMTAFAACSKVDSVANAPLQDLGNAFSTYSAQNKGANQFQRIRDGFRSTSAIIIVLSVTISLIACVFAPNLIALFVGKEEYGIISIGVGYLRIVAVFYVLLGFIVMFYGFFRGIGSIRISVLMTVVSQGLRVVLAYSFAPVKGFSGICWAIVIGWLLSDLIGFYMYKKVMGKGREG